MLVSVIIATHNSSEYIIETLKCIQNQTYKEFECIIMDDNSTDDTVSIVMNEFCRKDKRFIIYANFTDNKERHINDSFVVKKLFNLPKGKYTVHVDADDLFEDNMISTLVDFLEYNQEYDAVCGDIAVLREHKDGLTYFENLDKTSEVPYRLRTLGHDPRNYEDESFNKMNAYAYSLNLRIWNNQCYAIKTDVLKQLNSKIKFLNMCYGDYLFWCSAISEGVKLYKLSDILCYYNVHYSSISFSDDYILTPIREYIYCYIRAKMLIDAAKRNEFGKINIDPKSIIPWHINRVNELKEQLIQNNEYEKIEDTYKKTLPYCEFV